MNKKYKIELAKVLLEKIRSFTLNNDLELLTLNKQEYLIINYYITKLEEENERLKEWKEDLLKENIELENIRKEAIEYINDMLYPIGICVNGSDLPYESIESLLNILQNGSENDDK